MRRRLCLLLAAMLVTTPSLSWAQLGQTAVLAGIVTDTSGGAVPGATVTVTSPALIGGPRVVVSGTDGAYRFPALAPGVYRLQVELQGFKTFLRDNVRLELGQTITLNPVLDVGTLEESVTVTGEAPIVDTSSSAAQKNLSKEVMEMVPFTNRFGPGAMLLAPGVNPTNYTAYGSGGSSSNAYMIDGVDVSDPEGGTIWVFANHNWIQEVQVIGLGADAEYGGFTGVASNSLFRSGSNVFSGLFETIYENNALTGDNTSPELLDQNPDLTPGNTDYITDSTFQIGGPIKRDKAWFFTSFQYYRPKTAPSGFPRPGSESSGAPNARLESSPRFLFKPTVQLGTSDKLTGFFEIDSYTVDGRGASGTVAPIATVHQDSPELSWNINYTKILSSTTVFDVKYSGFWGYYYLSPYGGDDTPGWYDVSEDFYSVNSYYYYKADRRRSQANAAVTHYASGFAGDHNFKFGVEFERSYVKSEFGYPGDMYILADAGEPYGALFYEGYLKDNVNTRTAFYAQDSWQVNRRLTINPGVRMDMHRGRNQDLNETVFETNPVAPRIGFAFDLTGEGKTVLKAHYGLYYDGAKSTYYDPIGPNIAPLYYADIDPVTLQPLYDPYVIAAGASATIDGSLKHPRMRQFIAGIDHEIFPGWSLGVTGIYRKNDQFIDDVLQNGEFTERVVSDPGPDGVDGTGDETGTTITTYRQVNDALENRSLITNPSVAYREYKGVDINLKRRYANRWLFDLSWVISEIKGNIDNTGSFGNTTEFDDPNLDPRFQPFRDGTLGRDNTHLVKILAAYTLPWEVQLSGSFFYTTGNTYTRTVRVSLPQGRKDLFIEPRGSQRYDAQPQLNFKLEKQFQLHDTGRLGLTFEGFNVTNNAAITSVTTRSGSSYGVPRGIVNPRRWRLGAVYRF